MKIKFRSKKEVKAVCELLGLNIYEIASEGRFVCGVKSRVCRKMSEKF
ncbi:hypothetical protein MSIBF_A3030003 [groundwater metagenome]|uniref:Uncharacterized protein n=1 Tax=groundwater metagenome TaxID=717931 RepID=A0A098EAF5_9ZZZZ